uniref:Serine/threonine/tyrosine-interacting protein A-like n=1 Tax=Sinocyclocheilus grahami TaxID=75366 RepID=A0A672PAS1_SINGR
MRREMQEILPGLFLGPYSAAVKSKLSMLEKQGITHIVCVRQDIEANFIKPNFPHKFRYLVLDIADNPVENIIRYFQMTKEFIDGCLETGGNECFSILISIFNTIFSTFSVLMLGKNTFLVKKMDCHCR